MAVELDQVISSSIGGGNVTVTNVHVGNNSNRLLLVAITSHGGGGATTVKYNNISLTKLASKTGSFSETVELWGLVAPDVGTTFPVVTTGIDGGSFTAVSAISLYGCVQFLPTNTITATGTSYNPTLTLTTQYDGSWVVDAVESEAVLTVNSAQTQDWNIGWSSFEDAAGSHKLVTTAGTNQAMTWANASSQRWNQVAVEVLAVGGTTTSTSSTSSSSSSSSSSTSSTSSSSSSSSSSISTTSISTSSTSTSSTSTSSTSSSSSTSTTLGNLNSRLLGMSIMGLTKDTLDNPISTAQSNNIIDSIHRDMSSINMIDVTVPMNTNAQSMTERNKNFGIQPATYAAQFNSRIHAANLLVYWRATNCYFELDNGAENRINKGLYDFPWLSDKGGPGTGLPSPNFPTLRNGNRYSFFGYNIVDNFSSSTTRSHDYGLTSPAGNLTAHYLTSHQSGNTWSIINNQLVGPAGSAWVRSCLFADAPYLTNVVMVARVKKIGHQQIICRASTDSNFPGYGLQMRDTTIRIERPGKANVVEVAFTWAEGSYYWLKLECTGTTIRGKAWLDGTSEPGSWTLSATDSTYTVGYCGFSGEDNFGVFDSLTITPAIDTATWTYQAGDWLRTNVAIFSNGDIVTPFPEASAHQGLITVGDYNQFYKDLKYVIERIGTNAGKTLVSGYFSHLWTSAIQNAYASQYADAGVATYDHYSTGNGVNDPKISFNGQANDGGETAIIGTAISEASTGKFTFTPESVAYNQTIRVFIVNKGTGNWTMTIHDQNNTLVQMPDPTNFSSKTTTGVQTIANSLLTNGAYNTFSINWDNPAPDVSYHFHLTSTVANGTAKVKIGHANDLSWLVCTGYKGAASADAFEIDIRKTYVRTGLRQFVGEFGDYWSLDPNRSFPIRTQAEHTTHLQQFTAALQRLINENILFGFCYWRATGGYETLFYDAESGSGFNYQLNYPGVVWQTFFNANTPGTATSTSTSTTTTSTSSTSSSSSSTSSTSTSSTSSSTSSSSSSSSSSISTSTSSTSTSSTSSSSSSSSTSTTFTGTTTSTSSTSSSSSSSSSSTSYSTSSSSSSTSSTSSSTSSSSTSTTSSSTSTSTSTVTESTTTLSIIKPHIDYG